MKTLAAKKSGGQTSQAKGNQPGFVRVVMPGADLRGQRGFVPVVMPGAAGHQQTAARQFSKASV